jgi:AraC family transcriptional regulator of adaptative response/methylated-DNA-[protein]-cysteine methyltransferase
MSLEYRRRDYLRIANAIAYLRKHHRQPPGLAELARHAGLSEAHFQRLLRRWAGVSHGRFAQYLTVEYARQRMATAGNLAEPSLHAGLSGADPLHGLCVNMETMSPGEYRRQAAGMPLGWAHVPTPFGSAVLAFSARGICHLSFVDPVQPVQQVESMLRRKWPGAVLQEEGEQGAELAQRVFDAAPTGRPLSIWVIGSNFQVQVWRALLRIPYGELRSYRQVAAQVGRPRAARPVGSAIAGNPIGYLIPCHRVLRSSGEIGGYHWGTERKAAMIAWEAARLGLDGQSA